MTSYTQRGLIEHFAFLGDDSATNINRQTSIVDNNMAYNEANKYTEDVNQLENTKDLFRSNSVKNTDINETNAYRNYFKSNQNDKAVSNVLDITDIQMMTKDIQNIATATVMKTSNDCKTGVNLKQEFTLENIDVDLDIEISGINQRQIAQINFKCEQMNTVSSEIGRKVQASIVNTLANKMDSSTVDKVNENATRTLGLDTSSAATSGTTQGATSGTQSSSTQGATSDVSAQSNVSMGASTTQQLGSTQSASSSSFANVLGYEYFNNRGYAEFFGFGADDSSENINIQNNISRTNQETNIDNQTDINKNFISNTDIQKDINNTDDFRSSKSDQTDIQTEQYLNSEKYKNDTRKLGQNIQNIIKKNIKDTFSDEKINSCASEINQEQKFGFKNIKSKRGGFKLSNIHQDQAIMLMAECVTGNDTVQKMLNDMTNELGIKIDEDKKLSDVAERVRSQEETARSSGKSAVSSTAAQTAAGTSQVTSQQSSASAASTAATSAMTAATEQKSTSAQTATVTGPLSAIGNIVGKVMGGLGLMALIPIIVILLIIGVVFFVLRKAGSGVKSAVSSVSLPKISAPAPSIPVPPPPAFGGFKRVNFPRLNNMGIGSYSLA